MSMPEAPPKDIRRRVPWGRQAGACSLKVPLYTDNPEGELRQGLIRMPTRFASPEPNTNEQHEFDRIVRENIARWTDWLSKRGWTMVSTPSLRGPSDPPTATTKADPTEDGCKWYFVMARFHRLTPIWRPLEDVLYFREKAEIYGIKPEADPLPWNRMGKEDSGWVDPLDFAEKRRQRLGLKRKDFLTGPLWEPNSRSK